MDHPEKLKKLIQKQHGTVLSSDLDRNEIPRVYLRKMLSEGQLERVGRGVYVSVDSIEDEMYSIKRSIQN